MRKSSFLDRCFVAIVLLALLAFFSGVAFGLIDSEPRRAGVMLILQGSRN